MSTTMTIEDLKARYPDVTFTEPVEEWAGWAVTAERQGYFWIRSVNENLDIAIEKLDAMVGARVQPQ